MRVNNVHSRVFTADSLERVGTLIDGLASDHDRLWPHENWPAMRFDRPLGIGATGGHGPIRYDVVEYQPARRVRFSFTKPTGIHGYHEWAARPVAAGYELRHSLIADTSGSAVVGWPLIWQPLHDALIEDALDKAARQWGSPGPASSWSAYVRALRHAASLRRRR
jgi:hypothetical protein